MTQTVIQRWHSFVETSNIAILSELIADDAIFYSPVVHTPQAGKQLCMMYLMGAMKVFSQGKFEYVGQWDNESGTVLEFSAEVDGIIINGVDIIRWNADQKIVEFKVLVRPLKGVNTLHQKMKAMLEAMQ